MDKLDEIISNWEEYCESENCHSEFSIARHFTASLLNNGVDRDIAAKILEEGLQYPN